MTEQECLSKMVAPGTPRAGKYKSGVIQILVTRACNLACYNCTQGSQLGGKLPFMTVDQFRDACRSLKGYFGVVGMFGGNPALHPRFAELCIVMQQEVPDGHRGIWCNNPVSVENARIMRGTFDPAISNLNVHLDRDAFDKFKRGWPECSPVGLTQDSRHSPPFVAMRDVVKKRGSDWSNDGDMIPDESRIWELISGCDINQHWSAMVGVFRGELRAWFCEIAGAQAMLHQDEPDYPDTGLDPTFKYAMGGGKLWTNDDSNAGVSWWKLPMQAFQIQVRKHCFDCGVPLRGYGELSQAGRSIPLINDQGESILDGLPHPREQVSSTHAAVYKPKRRDRAVEVVERLEQIGVGKLQKVTHYLQNAKV